MLRGRDMQEFMEMKREGLSTQATLPGTAKRYKTGKLRLLRVRFIVLCNCL